jgi:hypothetical protein
MKSLENREGMSGMDVAFEKKFLKDKKSNLEIR